MNYLVHGYIIRETPASILTLKEPDIYGLSPMKSETVSLSMV